MVLFIGFEIKGIALKLHLQVNKTKIDIQPHS